jgi:general secretion pathway protein M
MNEMLSRFTSWWESISPREQKLLLIGSISSVFAVVYWGVLTPQFERAQLAETRLKTEAQLHEWVMNKADEIADLRRATGAVAPRVSEQPLNQLISSSVRRFDIELIRVQPRGDMAQAWIQPLPFNQLVNWLDFMKKQYGVDVAFLDISAGDEVGVVEVKRIQFKKAES